MSSRKNIDKIKFGLVIGRFQPLCNHHLNFLDQVISSGIEKLLIGVGQADNRDIRNFLPANEIHDLLVNELNKTGFSFKTSIIPDITEESLYVDHVKKYFPEIEEYNTLIFTDNEYLSDCFINHGHKYKVVKPKIIIQTRATDIRQMIINDNPDWQNLVPKKVASHIIKNEYHFFLKEINNILK